MIFPPDLSRLAKKRLKLKVCGLRQPTDLRGLAAAQPDFVGLIFYAGSPRYVGIPHPDLLASFPPGSVRTGVFVNASLGYVQQQAHQFGLKALQLHGQETPEFCAEAKQRTNLTIIKAFGVAPGFDFGQLTAYEPVVDYFLFDTKTPEHGGSGQTFDWGLLKSYTLAKPFFLSGGIDLPQLPGILDLDLPQLYGVDINSRFEIAPGQKDLAKIGLFAYELRR
ncbi:MAG: phosphoribosylanthranilate isomerase [Bernardetiaceae bacterium]|jgi:phosphoribosylanthranilate isomerase|nr:phosphoribosylanthranilate isomerase [Bernardetiaceae bacterium]